MSGRSVASGSALSVATVKSTSSSGSSKVPRGSRATSERSALRRRERPRGRERTSLRLLCSNPAVPRGTCHALWRSKSHAPKGDSEMPSNADGHVLELSPSRLDAMISLGSARGASRYLGVPLHNPATAVDLLARRARALLERTTLAGHLRSGSIALPVFVAHTPRRLYRVITGPLEGGRYRVLTIDVSPAAAPPPSYLGELDTLEYDSRNQRPLRLRGARRDHRRMIDRARRAGVNTNDIVYGPRHRGPPDFYRTGRGATLVPRAVTANGRTATLPGLVPGDDALFRTRIRYHGTRQGDFASAWSRTPGRVRRRGFNHRGLRLRPDQLVWHHVHDYRPSHAGGLGTGTMALMRRDVHDNMAHAGGVWQAQQYGHGAY
ncbi:HNH endonuclease [Sorangium sp. So ce726]|uniref:HNH endonuclease n=1 Tax=Sorangium sp. So ce726 TaxID=3133319 RepID=UPI003F5D863F